MIFARDKYITENTRDHCLTLRIRIKTDKKGFSVHKRSNTIPNETMTPKQMKYNGYFLVHTHQDGAPRWSQKNGVKWVFRERKRPFLTPIKILYCTVRLQCIMTWPVLGIFDWAVNNYINHFKFLGFAS